jgi:hypothetical protein
MARSKETAGGRGLLLGLPDARTRDLLEPAAVRKMRSGRTIAAHLIGRLWGTSR